ncbi:MAG: anion permease [Deltaproteobacteria bacterium]|nr:anion permease [Deltaproteobacteria bacterium]
MIPVDTVLVLIIVVVATILFITETLRVDVTALCVLVALLLLHLIGPEQTLYGFANTATAIVAAMFVLSAGLVRTGLVEWLARHLDRFAGRGERRLIVVLCIMAASLSAFMVNTATVAILIPVTVILAKTRNVAPSRVLIPLSFASQFGGVCTLIGTSTNVLVNSMATSSGLKPFHLFEFAPMGIVLAVIGVIYLTFFSRALIPKREGADEQIDKYRLADYLSEMRVTSDSPLAGKRWREIDSKDLSDIDLIKIIRGGKATWRASATKIRHNDFLLLHGNADALIKMKNNYRLETKADAVIHDKELESDKIELIEALVPPRSRLIGRTLRGAEYIERFGCVVLAMQRRGKVLRDRLADISFDDGDTLLLQCDKDSVRRILQSTDLIVTNELTDLHLRKDRAFMALAIFVSMILLVAFNVLPLLVAAMSGAVAMVLGCCITIEEAYKAIDWKIIFLLGGDHPPGPRPGTDGNRRVAGRHNHETADCNGPAGRPDLPLFYYRRTDRNHVEQRVGHPPGAHRVFRRGTDGGVCPAAVDGYHIRRVDQLRNTDRVPDQYHGLRTRGVSFFGLRPHRYPAEYHLLDRNGSAGAGSVAFLKRTDDTSPFS